MLQTPSPPALVPRLSRWDKPYASPQFSNSSAQFCLELPSQVAIVALAVAVLLKGGLLDRVVIESSKDLHAPVAWSMASVAAFFTTLNVVQTLSKILSPKLQHTKTPQVNATDLVTAFVRLQKQ